MHWSVDLPCSVDQLASWRVLSVMRLAVKLFIASLPECMKRNLFGQGMLGSLVLTASSHWKRRARGIDFYTLGAAYYLDVHDDGSSVYSLRLGKTNPVLNGLFGGLYELILDRFEKAFDCPFSFHDGLALPGFHIFGPRPGRLASFLNPIFFERGGTIHNHPTPQYLANLIGCLENDLPRYFDSVTIPLRLPAAGGGLKTWPSGVDNKKSIYRPYSVGKAVHFSGDLWHQIAPYQPSSSVSKPDYRITLQCHFVHLEGSAILFF